MAELPQSELDRRKQEAAERRERVQWQPDDIVVITAQNTTQ